MKKWSGLSLTIFVGVLLIGAYFAAVNAVFFAWLSGFPDRADQLGEIQMKFWYWATISLALMVGSVAFVYRVVRGYRAGAAKKSIESGGTNRSIWFLLAPGLSLLRLPCRYCARLHGKNFTFEINGRVRRVGFVAHRIVWARTDAEASARARDLIRQEERLAQSINDGEEPPQIIVEEVYRVAPWFRLLRPPRGFTFYAVADAEDEARLDESELEEIE